MWQSHRYAFKFFVCAIFLIFSSKSFGQTNVSGSISSNTTWTKSNSPYIVTANVTVLENITLTIEPGVTVKFNDATSLFLQDGILRAIGTPEDNIVFTTNSLSPISGCWGGVNVIGTNLSPVNQITVRYFKGMLAEILFNLGKVDDSKRFEFSNCTYANNKSVFIGTANVSTSQFFINNSHFFINGIGISGDNFKVLNSSFVENGTGVITTDFIDSCFFYGNYTAVQLVDTVKNCTIINNITGVFASLPGDNNTFVNNIIKNNHVGVELDLYQKPLGDFSGNIICNNSEYNIKRNKDPFNLPVVDFRGVCFCTSDSIEIENKILDAKDDANIGLVLTSPNSCIDDYLTISGKVYLGDAPMHTGFIIAINTETLVEYRVQVSPGVGEYIINSLPIGKYIVFATSSNTAYLPTYYPNAINSNNATVLDLKNDIFNADIHLQLAEDLISISGIVHKGNEFLENGYVTAINTESLTKYKVPVHSNGKFKIDSLPKGIYMLFVDSIGDNFAPTYYPNKIDANDAVVIDVVGDVIDVDIYLQLVTGITASYSEEMTLKVFPNPFNSTTTIEIQGTVNYTISTASGLVLELGVCDQACSVGNKLTSGLYFINLESEGMHKTVKLIKK